MNPRKSTSSFSKREKTRRNPFNRRNNRSISFRLWYIFRSYAHGCTRVLRGGTTGMNPKAQGELAGLIALVCPVHQQGQAWALRAKTGQQLTPFRRVVGLSRRERERYGGSSIRGNHMNLGAPAAPGLADRLRSVFLARPCHRGGP